MAEETTPYDRLVAAITNSRRQRSQSGLQGNGYGAFSSPMQYEPPPLDADQARTLASEIASRCVSADEVVPGLGTAIARGDLERLDVSLQVLGEQLRWQTAEAERLQAVVDDRLEGADDMFAALDKATREAALLGPLEERCAAYVRDKYDALAIVDELEAVVRRLRPDTATRLIRAAHRRATEPTA